MVSRKEFTHGFSRVSADPSGLIQSSCSLRPRKKTGSLCFHPYCLLSILTGREGTLYTQRIALFCWNGILIEAARVASYIYCSSFFSPGVCVLRDFISSVREQKVLEIRQASVVYIYLNDVPVGRDAGDALGHVRTVRTEQHEKWATVARRWYWFRPVLGSW